MARRTFLALDLDEPLLDALLRSQEFLDGRGAKLRPVERGNLHVTLHFLGDVTDELLSEVLAVAAEAAAGVQPFDFHVVGLAAMPPRGALRMVWVNVTDPTGRMAQLHQDLGEGLVGLGVGVEDRSFRPHVTLTRIKFADDAAQFRRAVAGLADTDFGAQHAQELVAYSSTLTPTGPIYTALARARLGE